MSIIQKIKFILKSRAFIVSAFAMLVYFVYSILVDIRILFTEKNLEYSFYLLLSLLPVVLSVFAILISFTDTHFLKFLKEKKIDIGGNSIYDEIVSYFRMNTWIIFVSLIWVVIVIWFNLGEDDLFGYPIFQYLTLFLITFTLISFLMVIIFIFYFAGKKADFVELQD